MTDPLATLNKIVARYLFFLQVYNWGTMSVSHKSYNVSLTSLALVVARDANQPCLILGDVGSITIA